MPPRKPADRRILDNQSSAVADYLRRGLEGADAFDLVSAYFSIYGYEMLADEMDAVARTRFLFGDPSSVEDVDPGARDAKSFELTERGLVPGRVLEQKALAKRCIEWAENAGVEIRSISQSNFLHGKMYLAGSEPSQPSAGVVGSSNFTQRGLGGSGSPNLEINLAVDDPDTLAEMSRWFDSLWADESRVKDVKKEVLGALNRIGRDYSPEAVYYKTLFELFRKDIEAHLDNDRALQDVRLYDTQIWKALYRFQEDGAKSVISRLERHGGCILADSVGLGKTYTALAVIKYFESRNERVLVLCPKKLEENWRLYQAVNNDSANPFDEDRFGYALLAHTDLSRERGMSGSVNLRNFNWGNLDLVVIDESHNFRNMGGERYKKLMESVIQSGAKTKVLMLSATPVNTSLKDLRSQINLITQGREDMFWNSLKVSGVSSTLNAAQREFKGWESSKSGKDKEELMRSLGAAFFRLLGGVSIARSRRHVTRFYSDEMERVGSFPKHEKPVNVHPPTDLRSSLSYGDLVDMIDGFALSIYRPSDYLLDESLRDERDEFNFTQTDREHFLIAMMRTNFLKRLESSPNSMTLTLERTIGKIDVMLGRIEKYDARRAAGDAADALPDEDIEDEDLLVNRARRPYKLSQLDLPRWKANLLMDKDALSQALGRVKVITPERDGKLARIAQDIRSKVQEPTRDADGEPNRKTLVFTTFKDTAIYLYENLEPLAKELGAGMAMVSGDERRATTGERDFNDILTNFAPVARKRTGGGADIDVLIATDCISEGQNLQDCDTVINYDIHWNPVRIIQRFGRIDRIGSRSPTVRMFNYWPTRDMDSYLKLRSRVQARMALADVTATGDDDPFAEEGARAELRFRNEQIIKMRDEVLDLDEMEDGVAMSDFTLDYFIAQLLEYLKNNQKELEAMPSGAYALAREDLSKGVAPGVIFFLRHPDADAEIDPRERRASPIHPFYMVYVGIDGSIRFGCENPRRSLAAFEAASIGESQPDGILCSRFDEETDRGADMKRYDRLLRRALSHARRAGATAQKREMRPDGDRNFVFERRSKSPKGEANFELVTWLVALDSRKG